MSRSIRRAMIDRDHQQLSLVRQCILLDVSRASVYYRSVPTRAEDLELMALMDRQYLKTPFYGSRKMKAWLLQQGYLVSRKRVRRLMRLMGLEAIYRRPNTSKPAPGHRIFPYLLKGVEAAKTQRRAAIVGCSSSSPPAQANRWPMVGCRSNDSKQAPTSARWCSNRCIRSGVARSDLAQWYRVYAGVVL